MKQFNIGDEVEFANYIEGNTLNWAVLEWSPQSEQIHGTAIPKENKGVITNINYEKEIALISYIGETNREVKISFYFHQIISTESAILPIDENYDCLMILLEKLNIK